jgi:hypothetical protein
MVASEGLLRDPGNAIVISMAQLVVRNLDEK